jgi:hypothetical protein
MAEKSVTPQSVLAATELAFWSTDFVPYPPENITKFGYDVLALQARGKQAFDPAANCGVGVYELIADVVETSGNGAEYFVDHRLALKWDNGEVVEFSLNTGQLVGDPDEPGLRENTLRTLPNIMRVLHTLVQQAA